MAIEPTRRHAAPADRPRLERSRLLAALGTAVFGIAASMARPKGACVGRLEYPFECSASLT